MPLQTRRRTIGREPAELIRRREVTRVLRRTDLSSSQREVVEKLSRSLVHEILLGPVSEIAARIETSGTGGGSTVAGRDDLLADPCQSIE